MAQIDLGQLRFFYLGEWNDSSLYETNDVVSRGANSYIYTAASSSSGSAFEPGVSSNWEKFTNGIRFVGQWNSGESYLFGDVVTDTVNTWIATQNLTSSEEDLSPGDNEAFIVFTSGTDNLPIQVNKDNYLLSTVDESPVWVDEIDISQATLNNKLYVGENSQFLDENVGSGSATIIGFSASASIVTLTTNLPHGFFSFQSVLVETSIGDERFDGEYEILDTPSDTTLTYESDIQDVEFVELGGVVSRIAGYTNSMAVFSGEYNDFAQIAVKNLGNDENSSTDIIAYASNGDDFSGWIGMGITAENFGDPEFTITSGNDGYIFMEAPAGTQGDGNLVIATGSFGQENKIVFAAGGLSSDNRQMEIIPDQSVVIEIPTDSNSPETGALIVQGGVGIQGNMNIQGNMDIKGEITLGGGVFQSENLSVSDPIVFTNTASALNIFDIGLVGKYAISGSANYSGVIRDYDDGVWKFFESLANLPTTTINFDEVTYADIKVKDIEADSINVDSIDVSNITNDVTFANNVSVTGQLYVQELIEEVVIQTVSASVVTGNYNSGNIFYLSSASQNFVFDLTNAPTTNGKTFTVSLIVNQGSIGYLPSEIRVDGVNQTVRFTDGEVPVATSGIGKIDIFNYTFLRINNEWTVLGNASLNF
jgi:hypothetical protein